MSAPQPSPLPARHEDRPVLLLVSDDEGMRTLFAADLARDHEVRLARDAAEARAHLAAAPADLVLIDDVGGRRGAAFEVREDLLRGGFQAPTVVLTSQGDEDLAVEALQRGFTDYITRRGAAQRPDLLRRRIQSSLEVARLQRENERLRQQIEESQARLFNVYDSLDDAIMQIDQDCRVVSVNRSAAALANTEPKDAVSRRCCDLFTFYPCEGRRLKESCHIYRTFLEGETIRGQREDPRTKAVYQYMTFITTLKDRDYVVYRETDVTEKRRLEERIANALRSLGVNPDRSS
jgi:DNA-binding response OmpR family regulator